MTIYVDDLGIIHVAIPLYLLLYPRQGTFACIFRFCLFDRRSSCMNTDSSCLVCRRRSSRYNYLPIWLFDLWSSCMNTYSGVLVCVRRRSSRFLSTAVVLWLLAENRIENYLSGCMWWMDGISSLSWSHIRSFTHSPIRQRSWRGGSAFHSLSFFEFSFHWIVSRVKLHCGICIWGKRNTRFKQPKWVCVPPMSLWSIKFFQAGLRHEILRHTVFRDEVFQWRGVNGLEAVSCPIKPLRRFLVSRTVDGDAGD